MRCEAVDEVAIYTEIDALIGRRTGWVLFYRSQRGRGWAKRDGAIIRLHHESLYAAGGCRDMSICRSSNARASTRREEGHVF